MVVNLHTTLTLNLFYRNRWAAVVIFTLRSNVMKGKSVSESGCWDIYVTGA